MEQSIEDFKRDALELAVTLEKRVTQLKRILGLRNNLDIVLMYT